MRNVVISRDAGGGETARGREDALASLCARVSGARVLILPSLYHLPEASEVWQTLAVLDGPLLVASWLHPRPTTWLLRRHGIAAEVTVLNLAAYPTVEECVAEACAALGVVGANLQCSPSAEALRTPDAVGANLQGSPCSAECSPCLAPGLIEEIEADTRPRWYPVVDQSRCTGCAHCLQFCLFGVYAPGADGRPEVAHPDLCKPGCPACSRICPEGAIVFPLYEKDDAIAGAPGKRMAPDLAARRMFYTRTKQPCPACGREGGPDPGARSAPPAALCPECGRTRPADPVTPGAPGALDDIDALIETLDGLAARRRS